MEGSEFLLCQVRYWVSNIASSYLAEPAWNEPRQSTNGSGLKHAQYVRTITRVATYDTHGVHDIMLHVRASLQKKRNLSHEGCGQIAWSLSCWSVVYWLDIPSIQNEDRYCTSISFVFVFFDPKSYTESQEHTGESRRTRLDHLCWTVIDISKVRCVAVGNGIYQIYL